MRSFLLVLAVAACSDQQFTNGVNGNEEVVEGTDSFTYGEDLLDDDTGRYGDSGIYGDADTDADGDSDADSDADTDTDMDTDTDTDTDVPTDGQEICAEAENTDGYLDQFQTPDDGKVLYCHSEGGSNYSFVDTSNDACLPHTSHGYDIFPTTMCDT